MLLGHVIANDLPSCLLGERASAGALLNGHLPAVVRRALPPPIVRPAQHGAAWERSLPWVSMRDFAMGKKPGKASIFAIQVRMAG